MTGQETSARNSVVKKKRDFLCIEYLNVQSLLCRKNDIETLLSEKDIDILCLTETWLTSNIADVLIDIPEYRIYRCDKGRGGGCCIYVKNYLTVKICKLNMTRIEGLEEVWLSMQCRKLPLL